MTIQQVFNVKSGSWKWKKKYCIKRQFLCEYLSFLCW